MSKFDTANPSARSWRDIPQNVRSEAMSGEGRRRFAFATVRTITLIVITAASAWGGFEVWRIWQDDPQRLAASGKSEPVRSVELRTDGVLDLAWVTHTLDLPADIGLMELDLFALQDRLLAGGQVSRVVLARKFPDTLTVTLEERSPVVRIRAAVGDGAAQDFLVARDGTVFAGNGFSELLTASLPWLAGVELARSGPGFMPLDGLDRVTELLVVAQANTPALYRSWSVVDLSRLASDGEIVVRARDVPEIVFGMRDDFLTQIAFLDSTLEQIAMNPGFPRPTRINLAVGGRQVPVAFGEPVIAAPSASNQRFFTTPNRNQL